MLFVNRQFFERTALNVSNTRLVNRIGDKSCRAFFIQHAQLFCKRFSRKLLREAAVFVRRLAHQRPEHSKYRHGAQDCGNNPENRFKSHVPDFTLKKGRLEESGHPF